MFIHNKFRIMIWTSNLSTVQCHAKVTCAMIKMPTTQLLHSNWQMVMDITLATP